MSILKEERETTETTKMKLKMKRNKDNKEKKCTENLRHSSKVWRSQLVNKRLNLISLTENLALRVTGIELVFSFNLLTKP